MLENFPWPQTVLGLAAALAILVIYDVVYVWPIHRRISRLANRSDGLERALSGVLDVVTRVTNLEQRGRDDLGRLIERVGQLEIATESRSYEQAITSAEHGEEAARLITCFGLTEGEADLVSLLHGDRSRRERLAKTT
jgi:Protein of unknown function (DUF2802)